MAFCLGWSISYFAIPYSPYRRAVRDYLRFERLNRIR